MRGGQGWFGHSWKWKEEMVAFVGMVTLLYVKLLMCPCLFLLSFSKFLNCLGLMESCLVCVYNVLNSKTTAWVFQRSKTFTNIFFFSNINIFKIWINEHTSFSKIRILIYFVIINIFLKIIIIIIIKIDRFDIFINIYMVFCNFLYI